MTEPAAGIREVPHDRRYTPDHLWVLLEGDRATVGVTPFGADLLGEVVYLDLPEGGTTLRRGEPFGAIESAKTVSELVVPIDGDVVARNDRALETPALVNESPYEDAWLIRLRVTHTVELDALLSPEAYESSLRDVT